MRVLKVPQVLEQTGLGRSSLFQAVQEGRFPKQVKIGPRSVGWVEDEVQEWIKERVAERDREAIS